MNPDLIPALMLFALLSFLAIAFAIRVARKGRVHFSRVDQQGGSALLSKGLMEMGYWGLQPLARLLANAGVTPNALSFMTLGFGLAAGICVAYGHFGSASVFAMISFLLDALDGMVARMTDSTSAVGKLLDSSLDRYVEFFFFAGLIIHYRHFSILLLVTLLALMGSFMVSYSTAKADAMGIEPPRGNMRRSERATYLTLGAALSAVTIPWLEADRQFGIKLAHPMLIAICLIAVLSNVSAVERLMAIARVLRQREKMPARQNAIGANARVKYP